MAKRMILLLLCAVLTVSCFMGCFQEQEAETVPMVAAPQTVSVMEQVVADGKELIIDVQVEVPDLSTMEEIQLVFDEALLDTMVEELVHSQYPDLKEGTMDGYRSWSVSTQEQLQFSLDCEAEGFQAGWTGYLDVLRNLNGQDVEGDERMRWTPYYMTPHIPDKLNMTSEEAAQNMTDFLERYSCFEYKPWNMVAVNCGQVPDSSGYYQAEMQPYYDGRPVLIDGVPYVSACLSAEGVFTFQGMMVLKEQSRKPAAVTMTLEDAVAQFKEDVLADSRDGALTLNSIKVGYVAQSHYDGTRVLSPAWIFEYSAVRPHMNTGEEMTTYYTSAYRMNNGELLDFS